MQSEVTTIIWILAGTNVLTGILILVVPLNSLHKVMKEAKNGVLKELEEEYDYLTVRFVSKLRELRHAKSSGRVTKEDSDISSKITALQGILLETHLQWTWPVMLPMVLRIIVTSMIPAIMALLSSMGII